MSKKLSIIIFLFSIQTLGNQILLTQTSGNQIEDFYRAIASGNIQEVNSFIEENDLDTIRRDGWKALHGASVTPYTEIAALLIHKGWQVDATDIWGWTPLHFAAFTGNIDMAKLLIDNNADLEAKDRHGQTPLFIALTFKDTSIEMAHFLMTKGANIDVTDHQGWTPLHFAARDNDIHLAEYLIQEKSMDVNAESKKGETSLDIALGEGHHDMADLLTEHSGQSRNRVLKFICKWVLFSLCS